MATCLITGAGRGLGLEFARQYAADDWRVIATCRDPDAAPDLRRLKGRIEIHALDVTDFSQIERLAQRLDQVPIDVLINNAGLYGPRATPYDFVDYAAWAEVMRVNTMAPLKISAVFSKNVARSERRVIVAITSMMGSIADNTSGDAYIYRSSKAALNAVVKSLSIDLRGKEITVVALHPGWVRTDMGGSAAPLEAEVSVAGMRRVIAKLALKDSGVFLDYAGKEIPW